MTRFSIAALALLLAASAEARFSNKWVGESEATTGPPVHSPVSPSLESRVVLKFGVTHRGESGPIRLDLRGVVRCRPRHGFCARRRGAFTGLLTQVDISFAFTFDGTVFFDDATLCTLTGRLDAEDPVVTGHYTCPTGGGLFTFEIVRNLGIPRRRAALTREPEHQSP